MDSQASSLADRRLTLPEPMAGRRAVRVERQRWERINRAEGELIVGYDETDRPVRVEYHWLRRFSLANPELADVYTAELWVRQADGGWLYLVQPSETRFARLEHAAVRRLFAQALDLDAGP